MLFFFFFFYFQPPLPPPLAFLVSRRSALLPAMGSQLSRWHSHFHRRSISKAREEGKARGRAEHPPWWRSNVSHCQIWAGTVLLWELIINNKSHLKFNKLKHPVLSYFLSYFDMTHPLFMCCTLSSQKLN